jgi:hypothetical protein
MGGTAAGRVSGANVSLFPRIDEGVQKVARCGEHFTISAMKRYAPLVLIVTLLLVVVSPFALAAANSSPAPRSDKSPAAPIATAISTVTGIAISPLLGTGAYGAYKWWSTKGDAARAALPWYAQMKFWLPALLLVAVCAAKDAFGAVVPPGFKKPLDVLETIENKFSGLVAAGAVIPFAMDAMAGMIFNKAPSASMPMLAHSGLATIQLGAFNASSLLDVLTVPFGVAIFVIVWLASHAINVLILLSPWGVIDAGLKAARTALLGVITLTATMNPWLSAGLSLVVIVISYFVAGWAFRLTIFGSIFSWEFITRRRSRFTPAENNNAMFAGAHLPGVPVRTYGRLLKTQAGNLEFAYRPWLVLAPRVAQVPNEPSSLFVGTGAFFSDLVDEEDQTVFSLPPRYRDHEEELVRIYGMAGVREIGLRKAWGQLREMLGGREIRRAPLAA